MLHGNYPRTFRVGIQYDRDYNPILLTPKKNPETALVVNNPTDLPEPLTRSRRALQPPSKKLILWVMLCHYVSKSED
jgi:hypothetical protein